jgi:hypothetical protein
MRKYKGLFLVNITDQIEMKGIKKVFYEKENIFLISKHTPKQTIFTCIKLSSPCF